MHLLYSVAMSLKKKLSLTRIPFRRSKSQHNLLVKPTVSVCERTTPNELSRDKSTHEFVVSPYMASLLIVLLS